VGEGNKIFSKREEVTEVFKKHGFEAGSAFDIEKSWFISSIGQD
jgi:hypothetical protein